MIKHLGSKIAISVYVLTAIIIGVWGYSVFEQRDGKVAETKKTTTETASPSFDNQNQINNDASSQSSDTCTNGTACNTNPVAAGDASDTNSNISTASTSPDSSAPPVSSTKKVIGPMLAHITPDHCNSNCQAFANDLSLFEYCEEACGISPIKTVSKCDDKKNIQKDYCLKDLAISKEDTSKCSDIKDANIQQSCKNRIAQDLIESNL